MPHPTRPSPGSRARPRLTSALIGVLALAACADLPASAVGPADDLPRGAARQPLDGAALFVNPRAPARLTAESWRSTRPADAALLERIAAQPTALWFGDWTADPRGAVRAAVDAASAAGTVPVLVLYNIPLRDCGQHSAGGAGSAREYALWIDAASRGIGDRRAVVILEPDALAGLDCLSAEDREARVSMLRDAVRSLAEAPAASVYLDAGNPRWHPAPEMSRRLEAAGIAGAAGFALNVSNFLADEENVRYGAELSALLGGKRFVIDTSRNGRGPAPDAGWCNPSGRGVGTRPTTTTDHPLVDAYLWIKTPGESDGECNGGPAAGRWWPEYALGLALRAAW